MNALTTGEIVWLGAAAVFVLSALVCLAVKRWVFGIGLLLPGLLLGWTWQYDRAHETTSQLNLLLFDQKLIKENREHPEKSLYFIRASGLELGMWEGKVRAENIHLTKQASIVLVKLGKRPLTGTYIKSVADQGSDTPPKQFKFVPPPKGSEFDWAFLQPMPAGMSLEQVHSVAEPKREMAQVAMAFHADRATFDRIRPPNLEEIPFESFSLRRLLQEEVVWWRNTTAATKIWGRNACDGKNYHPEKTDKFRHELMVVTWDEDGLVQYFWWGRGT